jgi:hypothetical protein
VLIRDTLVGFDAAARPVQAGPVRLFTGVRSDPFFADADGSFHGYNLRQPADDLASYLQLWSTLLEDNGYPPEEAEAAARIVLPDILRYDRSRPAAYPTAGPSPTTSSVPASPG